MNKFHFALNILFCFLLAAADAGAKQEHVIRGRTMGTTYSIKVVTGDSGVTK